MNQYSSNRRLPSRLFSSTRRLFGTGSAATPPAPAPNVPPPPNRSHTYSSSQSAISGASGPTQQRRLAEFATILGDFKLAVSVWESLRKDGKGGSVSVFTYRWASLLSLELFLKGNTSDVVVTIPYLAFTCSSCTIHHPCSCTPALCAGAIKGSDIRRSMGNRYI